MTDDKLLELGIYKIESKIHPRRYFVPFLGEVNHFPEYYEIQDIFEMIFKKGQTSGIEIGKEVKIKEIKSCLNL